ncbi:hypothetical protein DFH29DRAFT_878235 [Suillus ampliporus]|nr:hypothetical protein DFH29DRAFT_878235 [Suillus ampliporus]
MTIKQYNSIRDATMEWYPDDDIYSYYRVKQAVAELSGVVPILQALWRHPDQAERMRWREQRTQEILEVLGMTDGIPDIYEDVLHGKQYLDACQSGKIKEGDPVLMFSINGAQLCESKQLDCWIYIWVLFDHSPDQRYQKKPRDFQSGMAHLTNYLHPILSFSSRLQMGPEWHFSPVSSDITAKWAADSTNMNSTRLEIGITKPSIFCSFHSDRILPVPHSFGSDIMHVAAINAGDLLIPLWRGSFRADPTDDKATWHWAVLTKDTWKKHRSTIADATPYLPGSFDRPPRNPAEKIHSGYKAWELLLYLYGMAPATLFSILPDPYWTNFCCLARGLRLMQQYHISRSELLEGHQHLLDFTDEFEEIYYQCRNDQLHFIRPWIHFLTHIGPETVNKGPPICSSQWTMDQPTHCMIGLEGKRDVKATQDGTECEELLEWSFSNGLRMSSSWRQFTTTNQECPGLDLLTMGGTEEHIPDEE